MTNRQKQQQQQFMWPTVSAATHVLPANIWVQLYASVQIHVMHAWPISINLILVYVTARVCIPIGVCLCLPARDLNCQSICLSVILLLFQLHFFVRIYYFYFFYIRFSWLNFLFISFWFLFRLFLWPGQYDDEDEDHDDGNYRIK